MILFDILEMGCKLKLHQFVNFTISQFELIATQVNKNELVQSTDKVKKTLLLKKNQFSLNFCFRMEIHYFYLE